MSRQQRKQQKVAKLQKRDNYRHTWLAPLMETCPKHPGFFCFAIFCASCASYSNRKKALHGDMSRYICCNGDCPCSGRMKESDCPEFCLCLEAFCCFAQSVFSTRWMLQDRLGIQNTKCDTCIIQCMIWLQVLDFICSIAACVTQNEMIDQAAEITDCAADIARISVCACMQTQARYEMNENEQWKAAEMGGPRMQAPPAQKMQYGGGGGGGYPGGGYPGGGPPPPQYMQHPGGGAPPPPGYPSAAQGGGYPAGGPPPGYPRT